MYSMFLESSMGALTVVVVEADVVGFWVDGSAVEASADTVTGALVPDVGSVGGFLVGLFAANFPNILLTSSLLMLSSPACS